MHSASPEGTFLENIRELFTQSTTEYQFSVWNKTYEEYLKEAQGFNPSTATAEDLDLCYQQNPDQAEAVISMLHALGPAEVIHKFGEDAALWTLYERPKKYETRFVHAHNTIIGPHGDLAEKIRINLEQDHNVQEFLAVKTGFQMYKQLFDQGAVTPQRLRSLLQENSRRKLSTDLIQRYALCGLKARAPSGRGLSQKWSGQNPTYLPYLDVPAANALLFDQKPCAIIGYIPVSKDTLMLKQVQGVNPLRPKTEGEKTVYVKAGSPWATEPLWVSHFAAGLTEHVARQYSLPTVAIQSAENNTWVQNNHLPRNRAQKVYDQTAIVRGYELREDGNWYKDLE